MIKSIKNIIKSIRNPLTKEEKNLLHKLQDYILNPVALDEYRHSVKNNEKDSYYISKSKLVRNVLLGKLIKKHGYNEVWQYGNLEIWINHKYKEIFAVKNNKGHYTYDVDENKKAWLNKELGIDTYKPSKAV